MAGGGGLVAMLSSGSSATNKEPFRRKNWQKCPFASINVLKQPVEFKSKIFTAHTVQYVPASNQKQSVNWKTFALLLFFKLFSISEQTKKLTKKTQQFLAGYVEDFLYSHG